MRNGVEISGPFSYITGVGVVEHACTEPTCTHTKDLFRSGGAFSYVDGFLMVKGADGYGVPGVLVR